MRQSLPPRSPRPRPIAHHGPVQALTTAPSKRSLQDSPNNLISAVHSAKAVATEVTSKTLKMQPIFHIFLLAALAVVMVTSAPLTNQEKLVSVEQAGEAVDRAKRADEEIVFGNQQNKARVGVAKKSDILAPPIPPGERDQGSEVIVHKEIPVSEDLAARAEAAVGSASEHEEKMKEAVEAAIQSVAEAEKSEAGKVETETNGQEAAEVDRSEQKLADQTIEEEIEEAEQGAGEASDAAEEKVIEENEEDDAARLQGDAVGAVRFEGGSNVDDGGEKEEEEGSRQEVKDEEVEKFLQEKQEEAGEAGLNRDREAYFYEDRMGNYLKSLAGRHNLLSIEPFISRFRRSLHRSRDARTPRKGHRGRRIKRDLLDDSYYRPYSFKPSIYTPEDMDDALISSPDDAAPLTDEEAEYLNRKLVNYLTNRYDAVDQEEADLEESPLDSYLNGNEDSENEPYAPYGIFDEDNAPIVSNSYDARYPYVPVDFDSYQNYDKRGMIDYYPQEEEKRYFFPFSKEPETHWGAFVPEKRDYDEAIQRLQRLAMALSDNPGPYYREMLEEYRRK